MIIKKIMPFPTEPTHYIKTSLSDIQGAWANLRDQVIEEFGFKVSEKLIFH
tara:strand:+ start:3708 stop:3860 length:153 start_codon:yes stop_codon:yes gene_type:complete